MGLPHPPGGLTCCFHSLLRSRRYRAYDGRHLGAGRRRCRIPADVCGVALGLDGLVRAWKAATTASQHERRARPDRQACSVPVTDAHRPLRHSRAWTGELGPQRQDRGSVRALSSVTRTLPAGAVAPKAPGAARVRAAIVLRAPCRSRDPRQGRGSSATSTLPAGTAYPTMARRQLGAKDQSDRRRYPLLEDRSRCVAMVGANLARTPKLRPRLANSRIGEDQ
jgi:hypothetical protein